MSTALEVSCKVQVSRIQLLMKTGGRSGGRSLSVRKIKYPLPVMPSTLWEVQTSTEAYSRSVLPLVSLEDTGSGLVRDS